MLILHEINKKITKNKEQNLTIPNEKSELNTKRSVPSNRNIPHKNYLSFIYKSPIKKRANTIQLKEMNHSNNLLLSRETSLASKHFF